MSRIKALSLIVLLLSACLLPAVSTQVPAYDIKKIIDALPPGERWIQHLNQDLLPFWTIETALGDPVGNFPTYRCNDGSIPVESNLCPEYKAALADDGLKGLIKLDREYIRAMSRQAYAFGIAYHLTGNEKYLEYAKAGVDYFRKYGIDQKYGGAYTYYDKKNNVWKPPVLQRTSQDMAYALTGIGFYYYLTHDEKVLKDILAIKDHIFKTYYDKELGLLRWVIEPSKDGDSPEQKELVSQLDQVYAYMLWLAPSLPEPHRTTWHKDLEMLAAAMIQQFFSNEYQFFWGQITNRTYTQKQNPPYEPKELGTPHTDFGHSIKTLWLIYQIGKNSGQVHLSTFAGEKAAKIIDMAYIKRTGSWARRFDEQGVLDKDKEWWILAELDQTAATLGLIDPSYARYLVHTYDYWFRHMVDHKHKGVWHMVDGTTDKPILKFPKQHSWKSCLHTFEHALIGYLTTQQLKGEKITLHYAFKKKADKAFIHPYFYLGRIDKIESSTDFKKLKGFKKYTVTFTDLR